MARVRIRCVGGPNNGFILGFIFNYNLPHHFRFPWNAGNGPRKHAEAHFSSGMGDHNKTVQTIARCLSVSATIKTIGATVLLIYSFSVDSWLTQTDVLEYTVNDATFTARASLGLFNQCVECISTQCPDPALPANVKICEPVNSIQKCTACPNGAFALTHRHTISIQCTYVVVR